MARIRFKTGESIKENDENIPNTVELEVIDGKFQHIVDLEAIDEEMAEPLKSASSFLQESPLVKRLRMAIRSMTKAPAKSNIIFENTEHAANHNAQVLKNTNFDWDIFKKQEVNTSIDPENEFRELQYIKPLFDLHENGEKLTDIVLNGTSYHLDKSVNYSAEQADEDLFFNIERGNNKSTIGNEDFITKSLIKEVSRGWAFPIPVSWLSEIPGVAVTPIGVAKQFTLDEDGKIIPKCRMTHDCSRPSKSGHSLNSRIDDEMMEECIYGNCMWRILYQIHQLRIENPNVAILLSKLDFDSAYRRMSVKFILALLCTIIVGPFAYILCRLPFGVSPAAGLFSLLSDFVVDMANALFEDPTWSPSTLSSPLAESLLYPVYLSGDFSVARPLLLDIKAKNLSAEVFIDDMIVICLDVESLIRKATNAIPLILDAIFRPIFKETVERLPILNRIKTMAEGRLEEIKTILGWIINSRRLSVHLPKAKAELWIAEIESMIAISAAGELSSEKELESMIGKLNHAAVIVSEGNHFLNRLRYRLKMIKLNRFQHGHLHKSEVEDLRLWITMLEALKEGNIGRSFNHILRTVPEILCISDACETGMGGYFIIGNHGFAWRFELPLELRGIFSINLLEFLACYWTVQMIAKLRNDSRFLSVTDSTNALFWMGKNKHNPVLFPLHDEVSRAFGKLWMQTNCSNEKVHIAGVRNIISDSLSRDTHIPRAFYIQQMKRNNLTKDNLPEHFEIYAENEETLCSWLHQLKQMLTPKTPSPTRPSPSAVGMSIDGRNSLLKLGRRATPFSNQSQLATDLEKATTSDAFSSSIGLTDLAQKGKVRLAPQPFTELSKTLHRTSKMKVTQIPSETQEED